MKSVFKKSETQDQNKTHASAVTQQKVRGQNTLEFVDNRDASRTRTGLQLMINNSPRMVAQRMQLERSFGIPIQRQGNPEEEELLQGKFESVQKKENKTGLPDKLKTGVESLSGISMDDVRVYRNSDNPAQLQAHAYTQGTDIHLGAGQEKHLPHETWHVVQQKQGLVKPTMQMLGRVNINDDAGLEKEADVMGTKALQMKLKARY